jgi:hypothetical protein
MSKPKRPKDLLERMKRIASRRPNGTPALAPPAPEPPPEAAPRKKVRITIDLDPETHRFLKIYAAERGMKISEVVRRLIEGLKERS